MKSASRKRTCLCQPSLRMAGRLWSRGSKPQLAPASGFTIRSDRQRTVSHWALRGIHARSGHRMGNKSFSGRSGQARSRHSSKTPMARVPRRVLVPSLAFLPAGLLMASTCCSIGEGVVSGEVMPVVGKKSRVRIRVLLARCPRTDALWPSRQKHPAGGKSSSSHFPNRATGGKCRLAAEDSPAGAGTARSFSTCRGPPCLPFRFPRDPASRSEIRSGCSPIRPSIGDFRTRRTM